MPVDAGFAVVDALFLGLDFELAGVQDFFGLFALAEGFLAGLEAGFAKEGVGFAFAVFNDLAGLGGEGALPGAVDPAEEEGGSEGAGAEEGEGLQGWEFGQKHYGRGSGGDWKASHRVGVAR